MPACPSGHDSVAADYCDVCGDRIGGSGRAAAPAPVPSQAPPPLPSGGDPCPDCGTPSTGRFCEDCGYDFELRSSSSGIVAAPDPTAAPDPPEPSTPPAAPPTAEMPVPESSAAPSAPSVPSTPAAPDAPSVPDAPSEPAAPAVPTGPSWTAVITADRLYYETVIAEGGPDAGAISFPPYAPERRVPLDGKEIRIGRHSSSRGVTPEIDLREPPEDPGVSHIHAVLLAKEDGTWVLVDPGSTNGTTINDGSDPIDVNVEYPLKDGDRIYVGAWTAITLEAP